jgi:ATP-binding cassette subfamily B protein
MLLVMAFGALRCINGEMTLGTYPAFQAYSGMLTWPVRALGRLISDLGKTRISLNRLRDILGAEPEEDGEDCITPEIRGHVRFENVTFSYSGKPVLKDVSFEVKPGQTLAILGGTGSGKSTIAHLLCRLYDLPEGCGRITVDGTDVRRIGRRHLRRSIGLVLQEPFLFSKTVRENIGAAAPSSAIEEIRHMASIAAVDESILGFVKGYDTVVGDAG